MGNMTIMTNDSVILRITTQKNSAPVTRYMERHRRFLHCCFNFKRRIGNSAIFVCQGLQEQEKKQVITNQV